MRKIINFDLTFWLLLIHLLLILAITYITNTYIDFYTMTVNDDLINKPPKLQPKK